VHGGPNSGCLVGIHFLQQQRGDGSFDIHRTHITHAYLREGTLGIVLYNTWMPSLYRQGPKHGSRWNESWMDSLAARSRRSTTYRRCFFFARTLSALQRLRTTSIRMPRALSALYLV